MAIIYNCQKISIDKINVSGKYMIAYGQSGTYYSLNGINWVKVTK